jgi:ketosteroid isomerase-like protein
MVLLRFSHDKITHYILINATIKLTFKNEYIYTNMNRKASLTIWCCLVIRMAGFGQPLPDSQSPLMEEEATAMVTRIYKEVSGSSVQSVDWEKVRSFFVDEAVIVLRTSRTETSQFTVEEFIQDFKNFYQGPLVGESGFREEVLQIDSEVYLDMAFVAVVYAATILDSEREPQKGIDFWLLSRREDQWKVVSVTNEIVPADGKLPSIFDN